MDRIVYICLNGKEYDGTVFVTQIADWLKIYQENGVDFEYLHLFPIQSLKRSAWRAQQSASIKKVIPGWKEYSYSFPSRGLLVNVNAWLWARKIKKLSKGADKIVIFSRMIYGKEISAFRKLIKTPIYFIYDARAASVEENKYNAVKGNYLSKKQFDMFSHISYTECVTVQEADKIFSVSNQLKKYLVMNYGVGGEKFFIYPCLSDNRKFYYDQKLRDSFRKELGYTEQNTVYLYSGGLGNVYHVSDSILSFIDAVAEKDENSRFLLLSKDTVGDDLYTRYPHIKGKIINRSVPNEEIVKYLNVADYGLLFRENVPMNNVASPSKFAEYMLCGLPTLISEGVGDYSGLCETEDVGILINEAELKSPDRIIEHLKGSASFSREKIASYGKEHFSKQSLLPSIIAEFKKAL